MPQTQSIVQRRRARRADERRARATRFQMGGIGLGIIISFLLALLILFTALAYASLTSNLPNVELLPVLLNPPDGLLLQPTRIYDRTGQHLLSTFASGNASDSPRRYLPLNPQNPQHLPDVLAQATVAIAQPDFWTSPGYSLDGWQNPDIHPTIAQKLVSDLLLYNEPPTISTRRPRTNPRRADHSQIRAQSNPGVVSQFRRLRSLRFWRGLSRTALFRRLRLRTDFLRKPQCWLR